jgi:NTP pyrophosphatase (non-canonical NTP hydrolase)
MPTLNEAKDQVIALAKQFGWGISREHVGTKIYYAILELAEAGNAWKHRGDADWLRRELRVSADQELTDHVAEELIDTIFYCLNGLYCLDPALDVDAAFTRKWRINLERGRTYLDDHDEPASVSPED